MHSGIPENNPGTSDPDRSLREDVEEAYRKTLEIQENSESEDERCTPSEDSEDVELYFTCSEHSDNALHNVLSKLKIPKDGPHHVISISGGTEEEVYFDDSLKRNLLPDLEKLTFYDHRDKIHGAAVHDFSAVVRQAAETSKVYEESVGAKEIILKAIARVQSNRTSDEKFTPQASKMFLSFDCCQKTLRKQWYGHIDTIHFERKVVLATPIYWIFANTDWIKIDVSEDPTQKKEQDTDDANSSTKQPEESTSRSESTSRTNGSEDAKMTVKDKVGRYLKKCKAFYSSPIANFAMHCGSYFMFLVLYAYVLTFSHLDSTFHLADFVAHVWIFAILIEIARAMFNLYGPEQNFSRLKHFREWLKFTWNILAMITMATSIVAFLCRWFTATRLLGRICYGINYALFAFRVLRLYSATEAFGPWVSMIKHMFFTTFKFTVIFMVFLVGYGVAIQALLGEHSGEGISFLAIRDIFYKPYFQVFGELFLDDIPGENENTDQDAPSTVTSVVYSCFLAVYLFMGNVLLLNLIIAIFSYDIQRVDEMSVEIWKFEKYILHEEFMKRATLPEPLSLMEYFYLIGEYIVKKCRQSNCCVDGNVSGTAVHPYDSMATNVCEYKNTQSQNFVTHCLSRYVREEEQRQLFSIEAKTGRLERASGYIWEQNQTIIESARAIDSKSSALAGATSEIKYGTSELKEHTFGIQRDTSRLLDYNKKAKKSAVKLQKGQEDIASKMQLLEEHLQEWEDKSVKLPTLAETQDQIVSKVVEGVVAKLGPGIYKNDDTSSRPREDSGIVASPGSSFTSDPPRVARNDSVFVMMSGDNEQNEDDFNGAGGDPNITSELQDVKTTLSHTRARRTSKRRSEKREPAESPKRRHRERSDEAKKKRRNQKRNIVSSSPSSDVDSETTTDRRKRGKHSAKSERRKSRASDMHDSIKLTPDLHKKLKTSPIVASITYYWGIGPSGNIEQIGRIKSGPQLSKFH
ncbi:transient receptor potential cation channel subfamily M member 5-like [Ptychodera flava]|uniref:transient receptor potential cation channel subfamily M member 5-like n=1 Tax=Ptychodera flava TaxID=63121 RepID=UPI00396A7F86